MKEAQVFLHEYGLALGVTLIICVLLWLYVFASKNRSVKVPGEEQMNAKEKYKLSRRELKQKENNIIADEVENFLLKLYTDGKITEERYQHWHLRFGTQLGLKDLLPVKLTPDQIKIAARKRRSAGTYKPVPFFKEVAKYKPKNIIDAILNRPVTG